MQLGSIVSFFYSCAVETAVFPGSIFNTLKLFQMMPQSMIISNGVGGFIQYPQMQSPFFPQMAQVGGMQMILQPTLQLRHVSITKIAWAV